MRQKSSAFRTWFDRLRTSSPEPSPVPALIGYPTHHLAAGRPASSHRPTRAHVTPPTTTTAEAVRR